MASAYLSMQVGKEGFGLPFSPFTYLFSQHACVSRTLRHIPVRQALLFTFIDEKNKAQRDGIAYARSHSAVVLYCYRTNLP